MSRQPIDYSISYQEFAKMVRLKYEQSVKDYKTEMLQSGESIPDSHIRSHVEEFMMGHISQIIDEANLEMTS
jgi:hypothetical protein